jgi:hypothetical protein
MAEWSKALGLRPTGHSSPHGFEPRWLHLYNFAKKFLFCLDGVYLCMDCIAYAAISVDCVSQMSHCIATTNQCFSLA